MNTAISNLKRRAGVVALSVTLTVGLQVAHATGAKSASADAGAASTSALAYAAQGGGALYKAEGAKLFRSADNGKSWTSVTLPAQAQSGKITSIKQAAGKDVLYVAGPGLGVLRSDNGGQSWSAVDAGLPSKDVTTLATHSTIADTLIAVVADEGIYRSEDAGKNWKMMDKGPRGKIRRLIHTNMEGSMQTGWLFAATDKGVYRSMDCFCGFRKAGELPDSISTVTYDPKQPAQVFAASGEKVFVSENGGQEWQAVAAPGGETSVLVHTPEGKLLALLGNGKLMESENDGKSWQPVKG
jgi:photosystem II stability/assembly factor-like uncharacterized protein